MRFTKDQDSSTSDYYNMYTYKITRDFIRSIRGKYDFVGIDIMFGERMVEIKNVIDKQGNESFLAICNPSVNKCKLEMDDNGDYVIRTARKINKTGITTYVNKWPFKMNARDILPDEIMI